VVFPQECKHFSKSAENGSGDGKLLASVSSFGYSGTIASVIVENTPFARIHGAMRTESNASRMCRRVSKRIVRSRLWQKGQQEQATNCFVGVTMPHIGVREDLNYCVSGTNFNCSVGVLLEVLCCTKTRCGAMLSKENQMTVMDVRINPALLEVKVTAGMASMCRLYCSVDSGGSMTAWCVDEGKAFQISPSLEATVDGKIELVTAGDGNVPTDSADQLSQFDWHAATWEIWTDWNLSLSSVSCRRAAHDLVKQVSRTEARDMYMCDLKLPKEKVRGSYLLPLHLTDAVFEVIQGTICSQRKVSVGNFVNSRSLLPSRLDRVHVDISVCNGELWESTHCRAYFRIRAGEQHATVVDCEIVTAVGAVAVHLEGVPFSSFPTAITISVTLT
jgi:hypothetical protein